jgi:hypothetical protein
MRAAREKQQCRSLALRSQVSWNFHLPQKPRKRGHKSTTSQVSLLFVQSAYVKSERVYLCVDCVYVCVCSRAYVRAVDPVYIRARTA